MFPKRVKPRGNQESVWDYPRPPRCEPIQSHIQVLLGDEVIADTDRSIRVLETSHPPVYYLPPADIRQELLRPLADTSWCEWKGKARYYDIEFGGRLVHRAAWSYPSPHHGFESIRDYLAFYPQLMDACLVDGETVRSQPGEFYGGWITRDVVGPFKGDPGSYNW
jgi:uncharacterized protein (DUF427 family)